jgi:glycosyltransferase involved in cell wall biosynthesis
VTPAARVYALRLRERLRAAVDDLSDVRLVLFTDTWAPQLNGVTRTLARLADAVRARGGAAHVVTVAIPGADASAPPARDVERWASAPFWAYPELRLAAPRAGAAADALRRTRATLAHVATPFGVGLAGRRAARALGVPLVSSYHTSLAEYARFYRLGALAAPGWRFLRWFHAGARRTYAPTRAVADDLRARGLAGVGVWGRGVDADRFHPDRRCETRRAAWGAADGDLVVLYVGRLAREKGLDLLLDAWHVLRARLAARPDAPRARLVLVGDGPHEAALRARAPSDVVFAGRLSGDALAAAYASADLFAFPSRTDTFGNVLLEAMASGLATVGVEAGPTREPLGGGAYGRVADAAPEPLADALLALAHSPAVRRALGARARRHARTRGWPAVFDALFADYRAVLAEAAPPA